MNLIWVAFCSSNMVAFEHNSTSSTLVAIAPNCVTLSMEQIVCTYITNQIDK